MTDKDQQEDPMQVSRRGFIWTAAVAGGSMLGAGLIPTRAAAAAKLPQKAVQYQPVPKNGNRCANCALWQLPASCKVVEGPISPAGWCNLFAPKQS
jgi:hypothetical protein